MNNIKKNKFIKNTESSVIFDKHGVRNGDFFKINNQEEPYFNINEHDFSFKESTISSQLKTGKPSTIIINGFKLNLEDCELEEIKGEITKLAITDIPIIAKTKLLNAINKYFDMSNIKLENILFLE